MKRVSNRFCDSGTPLVSSSAKCLIQTVPVGNDHLLFGSKPIVRLVVGAEQLRDAAAAIYHAASDRVALVNCAAVAILQDRVDESDSRRRRARTGVKSLAIAPAVIAAFDDDVHLLVSILADVAAVQSAGRRIDRKSTRL